MLPNWYPKTIVPNLLGEEKNIASPINNKDPGVIFCEDMNVLLFLTNKDSQGSLLFL